MKFFTAVVAFVLSSIAASDQQPEAVHLPAKYISVPIIRQATSYSCGAAALLSILTYWNLSEENESSLYASLGTTPDQGTHPRKIEEVAKKYNLAVRFQEYSTLEDLQQGLNNGETTILDIQAWGEGPRTLNLAWKDRWEDGHYVVLIAMDNHFVYLEDPSVASGYTYIPISELEDRWHDYEIENGERRPYIHLALFMKGQKPLEAYPKTLLSPTK